VPRFFSTLISPSRRHHDSFVRLELENPLFSMHRRPHLSDEGRIAISNELSSKRSKQKHPTQIAARLSLPISHFSSSHAKQNIEYGIAHLQTQTAKKP